MTEADDNALAQRGARILIEATRSSGSRTLDDLLARPDARQIVAEAGSRMADRGADTEETA